MKNASKETKGKKEYVSPNIIVRNVRVRNTLLNTSKPVGDAYEDMPSNLHDALGTGDHTFHNDFGINNEWGNEPGAL